MRTPENSLSSVRVALVDITAESSLLHERSHDAMRLYATFKRTVYLYNLILIFVPARSSNSQVH
jgi:hypothetical protein